MNKYEVMAIVRPDLPESERQALFNSIGDVITKNNGKVLGASIWAERKKLAFRIKKYDEGTYYLVNFSSSSDSIKEITRAYRINENILRAMIVKQDQQL